MNKQLLILCFTLQTTLLFAAENVEDGSFAMNKGKLILTSVEAVKRKNQDKMVDAFRYSIKVGDDSGMLALLDLNTDLQNYAFRDKRFPLQVAIKFGQLEVFKKLIQLGVNTEISDELGGTLLHTIYRPFCACKSRPARTNDFNFRAAVALLDDAGININAVDDNGNTALHYAILNGDVASVKYLLLSSADVTINNRDGFSPLVLSRLLLDSKFDIASYCKIYTFSKDATVTDENRADIVELIAKHAQDAGQGDALERSVMIVSNAQAAATSEQVANASTSATASTGGYVDSILRFFRIR